MKTPKNKEALPLMLALDRYRVPVARLADAAGVSEGTIRAFRDTEGRHMRVDVIHSLIAGAQRIAGEDFSKAVRDALMKPDAEKNAAFRFDPAPPPTSIELDLDKQTDDGALPRVAVRGAVQGGPHGAFQWTSDDIDYVKRPTRLAAMRDVYALYVQGDSMSPRFEPGELLFVNPHRDPRPGDDVVVQFLAENNEVAAMVKRYVRRSPEMLTLSQFNPPRDIYLDLERVLSMDRVMTNADIFG